jgi:hypothetical protein
MTFRANPEIIGADLAVARIPSSQAILTNAQSSTYLGTPPLQRFDVPDLMPKRCDDQFLDVWSRDAGDAAGFVLAVLQHRLRDVVAIAHALLVGMARAHQVASIIEEKTREEGRRARRHEGERKETPDVTLDLILAAGDLLE